MQPSCCSHIQPDFDGAKSTFSIRRTFRTIPYITSNASLTNDLFFFFSSYGLKIKVCICRCYTYKTSLEWRHIGRDGVSNHHTIGYSTVSSGADQRKDQSSMSLAFVRGIHRWLVSSPHKWPVTRKMFPFDDVIMKSMLCGLLIGPSGIWMRF